MNTMKYNLLLLALLTLSANILAAQGIEFFHGSWEEALEKAKAEEKVILWMLMPNGAALAR